MHFDVAGLSSSSSRDLFELLYTVGPIKLIQNLLINRAMCRWPHLGFERDCNSHTAFRVCYVIMHQVYFSCVGHVIIKNNWFVTMLY